MKQYKITNKKTNKEEIKQEGIEFDTYFNELINDHVYKTTIDPDNVDQEIEEKYKDCKEDLEIFGYTNVGYIKIELF